MHGGSRVCVTCTRACVDDDVHVHTHMLMTMYMYTHTHVDDDVHVHAHVYMRTREGSIGAESRVCVLVLNLCESLSGWFHGGHR